MCNCYECNWRGSIPGNAHSRCLHPDLPEKQNEFQIKGNELGIRRGWFRWPHKFDPVFLLNCAKLLSKDS